MAHVHFSAQEQKLIEDWLNKHDASCAIRPKKPLGLHIGMLGERLTYSVTPCSLGNLTSVRCGCGASLELPIEEEGVFIGEPKELPAP